MSEKLRQLGYETAMVFVNTDLETAQQRNKLRARTLPEDVVSKMWSQVQNNIGKFQRYFKEDMFIIDNSEGSDVQGDLTSAFKQISAWSKTIPNNRIAQQWMAGQAKSDK